MNKENTPEQWITEVPDWVVRVLPLMCAVAGGLLLTATWFFYKDSWNTAGFHWYQWIRPALMVLAGILCLIAAALLAMHKPVGWNVLLTAAGMIPVILAIGLVMVAIRVLARAGSWIADNSGRLSDGTFLNQLTINPRNIAISALILAIVLLATLVNASKSKKTPGEKK